MQISPANRGYPLSQGLVVNAGHANAFGGELDLVALPFEDMTLGFSAFVAEGDIVEGDGEVVPDHSPLPQLADFERAVCAVALGVLRSRSLRAVQYSVHR